MKKFLSTVLTLVMMLELGFNGGTVVHAAKGKVLSKVTALADYPADGEKPSWDSLDCYANYNGKKYSLISSFDDKMVDWYEYNASEEADFSLITKWNESDWKLMKKNDKFKLGKIYLACMHAVIGGIDATFSNQKSAYVSNKNSKVLDVKTYSNNTKVDIRVAYKCGIALKSFYFEFAKDIQIGKTPKQMNAFKLKTDPEGALLNVRKNISRFMRGEEKKETSEWLKSIDGKNWDYMKADEKFKYNVHYKYNEDVVLFLVMAIALSPKEWLDNEKVVGISENARIYVNGKAYTDKTSKKIFKKTFIRRKPGKGITTGKLKCKILANATKKKVGKIEITGAKNKNIKSVKITDTVKIKGLKYKVTSIKAGAFKNNKKLKKVVIGKNVTKIGKNAFFGCINLKKVNIKSTVLKKVGKKAFYRKKGKKITFAVPKKFKKKYAKSIKSAKTNNYTVK